MLTKDELPFIKKFFDHLLDQGWFLLFHCDDIHDAQSQKIYLQEMGYKWHDVDDIWHTRSAIIISPRAKKMLPYHPRRTPDKTIFFENMMFSLSNLNAMLDRAESTGKDMRTSRAFLKTVFNDKAIDYMRRGMPSKKKITRKRAQFKQKKPKA